MRTKVQLLIYEAYKIIPPAILHSYTTSAGRITELFLELLSRQFPLSSQPLILKSANDYAHQLSMHTNHLNKVVRTTTGKTSTEHIATHILQEAVSLLKTTNLNIAEISYRLGFEHPANFNRFFGRRMGKTPNGVRKK